MRPVDAPLYGVTAVPPTHEPPYTADRDLYLSKAGGVVEATDPARLTLLVRAGGTLPAARARELGLIAAEDPATADRGLFSPANRRRAELIGRILAAAARITGVALDATRAAGESSEEDLEAIAAGLEAHGPARGRRGRPRGSRPEPAVTDPEPESEPDEAEAESQS